MRQRPVRRVAHGVAEDRRRARARLAVVALPELLDAASHAVVVRLAPRLDPALPEAALLLGVGVEVARRLVGARHRRHQQQQQRGSRPHGHLASDGAGRDTGFLCVFIHCFRRAMCSLARGAYGDFGW